MQLPRRFQISNIIHIQLEMSIYTCLVSLLPEHLRFQIIRESFQSDLILFAADFHIFFRLFQ